MVTGFWGVWRADLQTGAWEAAHDGLPTAQHPEEGHHVRRLVVVDDELMAFGADGVYLWEGQGWSRLTVDSYAASAQSTEGLAAIAPPRAPAGIRNVLSYDGLLLVANYDGLYELNAATGRRNLLWEFDGRMIEMATVLPSGLYLGLAHGGLWRF